MVIGSLLNSGMCAYILSRKATGSFVLWSLGCHPRMQAQFLRFQCVTPELADRTIDLPAGYDTNTYL
jgi:hypothetical protein